MIPPAQRWLPHSVLPNAADPQKPRIHRALSLPLNPHCLLLRQTACNVVILQCVFVPAGCMTTDSSGQ